MNETQPDTTLPPTPQPWRPAPDRLTLEPGQVHVFRLALDLPTTRMAHLVGLLSPDEAARAARFRFEVDRQRFTAGRGQMRCILAAYLRLPPTALIFSYNPHGKPALVNAPGLHFNLSHSAGVGLLAVCAEQSVGIDNESIRPQVERDNIARRFFAPQEAAALQALPPEQQLLAFFTCWTRKEAYIKARGQGLHIPLDQFVVSLAPGEPARLLTREPGAPAGPFTLAAIDPGSGQAAALAVEGEINTLRLWDWP